MRKLILAIGIIAVVAIGILVAVNANETNDLQTGVGGGPENNQMTQTNPTPQPNTTDNDITLRERGNLHRLFQEHAVAASMHLQRIYDGEETTDTAQRLSRNGQQIVQTIAQVTNSPDASSQLLPMWQAHITEYEAYTMGLKENDTAAMQQAHDNLEMHAEEFGPLMNSLVPSLSANRATQLMNEHVDLTLSVIDAHAEENTTEKLARSAQASTQAAEFAEAIVPDTSNSDQN